MKNFTSTILATHSHASRPIGNQHRSYTPPHIHQLIQHRIRLRKQYHRTLSPAHKTELNRAQQLVKNTLKQYSIDSWNQRLSALRTQDNSLWHTQKLFKNKRQAIPPLECDRGTAITDTQKANLFADSLKENFTENTYQNRDTNTDNHINNTVNTFISTNPTTYLDPVLPDEIITYIKKSSSKKAPAVLRPILSYRCPVWGYAAKTNINILDVAQNTLITRIVGACRYMRNDEIRTAIKIPSFKLHIQKLAKNSFNSLNSSENVNMQKLENYTARIKRKRPRSILLDS
ncbi:putative RNA-directed DNA polymerase from transposon X-element [Trichonephila clavipes]|nr:putative RNA-directed DNA polymerase from transposon X-element [Trichonephila clavipes]